MDSTTNKKLTIEPVIVGSGSYGIIHRGILKHDDDGTSIPVVAKRPWTRQELLLEKKDNDETTITPNVAKQRAERCLSFWQTEKELLEKAGVHDQLPLYRGAFRDDDHDWLVFEFVSGVKENVPAPTLADIMAAEWNQQHESPDNNRPRFSSIQRALGFATTNNDNIAGDTMILANAAAFQQTMDALITSLLTILVHVHDKNIVHRDIKPANLLCCPKRHALMLIDFGSAVDLEREKKHNWWNSAETVAVSPAYAAPELFIDPENRPASFDVFSAGLLLLQCLFEYYDDRVDAGFRQQLQESRWDLEVWLEDRELTAKVRPSGMTSALYYCKERPGLWRLLCEMLREKPHSRISSRKALERWEKIIANASADSPFFRTVLESLDVPCLAEDEDIAIARRTYVASFRRSESLGLYLSEVDDDEDSFESPKEYRQWQEATKNARPGQVFVKGIVPHGQADRMGIFRIGDALHSVGELTLQDEGFERVLEMLQAQPRHALNVKLHFTRQQEQAKDLILSEQDPNMIHKEIHIRDYGVWSTKGRRTAQEDTFVLYEVPYNNVVISSSSSEPNGSSTNGERSNEKTTTATNSKLLVAGVMDGHGGTAASAMVQRELPRVLDRLMKKSSNSSLAANLEQAWNEICERYRAVCDAEMDTCIADYDPREGTLLASTGSTDLVAGTTACLAIVDEAAGEAALLNCGDSRSVVLETKSAATLFETTDHTPQMEAARLRRQHACDSRIALPRCSSLQHWWLPVGEYRYALARALEGPFATSRGIASTPDVTTWPFWCRDDDDSFAVVIATDGLWEVMDTEEVTRVISSLRHKRSSSAEECAKSLCSMALEKRTSDNVSVIVIYL